MGNIPPKWRSSLKVIQLVTIVRHSLIHEYGIDKILQPFMESIKKFEKVINNCMNCIIMVFCSNRQKGLISILTDSSTIFVEQLPLFVLITLLVGHLVVTKLWQQLYVNVDFAWLLLRICHLK